jgi:hypothetical protein
MEHEKVDFMLERMYEAAFKVQALKPPYVYGGRDPSMGLDCSGFGMILLGRAGYKSAGTDWNTSGLYTNVYNRETPDSKLGPRADELKAYFLWYDDPSDDPDQGMQLVHVAFPASPSLVAHAIDSSRDILMWYGLLEASERADAYLSSIDAEMWNGNGEPRVQGFLIKMMADAWDFVTDNYAEDWIDEVYNKLVDWSAYKDEAVVSPDEARAFAKKFRARKMATDALIPEKVALSADSFRYDISVAQDMQGLDAMREEIVNRIFSYDKDSVIGGTAISMTTEAKFIGYYNGRSNFDVETRYMPYQVVNENFRVPARSFRVFGEGSSESS